MSIEIVKIDARKALPYYSIFLLLTVGYILFEKKPLTTGDLIVGLIVNVAACLQGMVIAWTLFNDSGGTAAYIFSRPLSRKRLFLTRWCMGISLQLLTVLAVFVIISTGVRSWIQMLMNSPYQPMVKWHELSIVGSVALYSILGYQVVMFLRLRANIVGARSSSWRDNLGTVMTVVLCLTVSASIFQNDAPMHYRLTYATLAFVVGTLGSMHCYQCREIEG